MECKINFYEDIGCYVYLKVDGVWMDSGKRLFLSVIVFFFLGFCKLS